MVLLKYLWIVILIVYFVILSLYTYFAFQEADKDLQDRYRDSNKRYTTMDIIYQICCNHEGLAGCWIITLAVLFLISVIIYGISKCREGG